MAVAALCRRQVRGSCVEVPSAVIVAQAYRHVSSMQSCWDTDLRALAAA